MARATRTESQLKRMKVGEEKRPSLAEQQWVGGVLGSRCSSEIDVRAAVKWEGLLELLNAQSPSFHNSLGGFGLHRPRQRLSGSNMNITDTHSPSDTHSHSAILPAQVETHTLVPELENLPFKTLFHGHCGDDPTEISSSNVINDKEFSHQDADVKQLDENTHMAVICEPPQAKLVVDEKLILGVQSNVKLEAGRDVGVTMEPEVVSGADSEMGVKAESGVMLGVESNVGETLHPTNKHDEPQNEEENSNMSPKDKLIISPATAETLTAASLNNPSDKIPRNSTNQELACKSPRNFFVSKGEKKSPQSVKSEHAKLPNSAACKSVNSFRRIPVNKSVVSPEPSPTLLSQKRRPHHHVRTLTQTEKQSMRKVISVSSTKPHLITHSQTPKVLPPTTHASSGTATSPYMSTTPKMSSIQKSLVKRPMIYQKSAPEEKICRSTLRTLAMPTQESHTHTQKTTPRFAGSTVASSTRRVVTTNNSPVSQKEVPTPPKASSPNRTVARRASRLSMTSTTGSTDLPLPPGHIKKMKEKSVRPVWR